MARQRHHRAGSARRGSWLSGVNVRSAAAVCQDPGIDENPETTRLADAQQRRADDEARLARSAAEQADADGDTTEVRAHARRAEQAAYLGEKLKERARSEDD